LDSSQSRIADGRAPSGEGEPPGGDASSTDRAHDLSDSPSLGQRFLTNRLALGAEPSRGRRPRSGPRFLAPFFMSTPELVDDSNIDCRYKQQINSNI
jgi:hypothetical protein